MLATIKWTGKTLELLDQTQLPLVKEYVVCTDYRDVQDAIGSMKVRGAPAIGVSAAYGMALAAYECETYADSIDMFLECLDNAAAYLISARPTAVNLAWAVSRMLNKAREIGELAKIPAALAELAQEIEKEDIEICMRIGRYGAELLPSPATVLTHCNAGSLATAGYGTALGVIRAAVEAGKEIEVYADETRPFLQGARLTAFELAEDNIPVTLITDNMAAYVMSQGIIDCVIVGADRIAANGDVANKIGTYGLAVLAREHDIPFYVAAPRSTFDFCIQSGQEIVIEERDGNEVAEMFGQRIAPEGIKILNPAFDVTPHRYVTAIITELGVIDSPCAKSLTELLNSGKEWDTEGP
jgi:methylthioribose-1-phosphate isomerase